MEIDVRNVNSSGKRLSPRFFLLFIPLTSNKYILKHTLTHNCNAIKLNGCNKFINQEAKEEKKNQADDFEWEKLRRVLSHSLCISLKCCIRFTQRMGMERESQDDTIRSFIIVFYRGWEHTLYTHTEWGQIRVKT